MNFFKHFGHGGGKIKRKSIMAVLLLFTLALPLTANTAFATTNITNENTGQPQINSQILAETTNQSQQITKTNSSSNNLAAGSPSTVSFTSSQINSASSNVKSYVDINGRLPSYVTISNMQVTMPQFLQLVTDNLLNINSGLKTSVTLENVNNPSSPVEDAKSGTLYKSEYLKLAQSIKSSIDNTGTAPDYVTSSLGKIRYESLIYTFSKVLNFQANNQRLPNTVSVNPWTESSQPTTPSEGTDNNIIRTVYIVSDNINSYSTDKARINSIISGLAKLGVTAVNYGIGPKYHLSVLTDKSVPKNALVVEIAGGACAGTIWEKGTTWYKNLVGNKKVFIAFTNGATKITGLSWLPRSHDDNFSPSSFKGLANPDQYLLKNGYNYFEGLTNNNINQLVQSIYNVATS